jgi:hypothetical protein
MKKFELNVNETLEYDVDDLMETTIFKFHEDIKDIPEEERLQFRNWLKIYKILNYDIFEEVKVTDVYRFSKSSAVIKLEFKGKVEYDFLLLNDDSTVRVINIKGDQIKRTVVRRLLIPQTAEEALMYGKSEMTAELKEETFMLFNKIQTEDDKYNVTKKLHEYLNIEYKEPEVKEEEVKEEPKTEEYSSEKNYEEEVKEETKSESIFSKFKFGKNKKKSKKESVVIDLDKDREQEIQEKLAKLIKEQEEIFNKAFNDSFNIK